MKKLFTCFLLSILPVQGFTAMHTNADHSYQIIDHAQPAIIHQPGSRTDASFLLDNVCNGQSPSPFFIADMDGSVEHHGGTNDISTDDSHYPRAPTEELAPSNALLSADAIPDLSEQELIGSFASTGILTSPAESYFAIDLTGLNGACLAELTRE